MRMWAALALWLAVWLPMAAAGAPMRSILDFGVSPQKSPEENREALQAAIDWASPRGAALFVDPTEEPYPVAGGIQLRANVSLVGVHGPVGRGTRHPDKPQPVGSVFRITDRERPFLTVQSATQVRGIQFWYSEQTLTDPAAVIEYPPTIQVNPFHGVFGVTLSSLTFFGEFVAMDFNSPEGMGCEQILVEHCYGYPLSGEFFRIDRCTDVPRVLHCHVNPANRRLIDGDYSRAVIDSVVARRTFAYAINRTDNAQLMDLFAFGVHGGAYLGPATYGQLTNFNFDCVTVGIRKRGDQSFNRNWQIAQGSIIANTGAAPEEVHPFIIEGQGHTAVSNVEAFSGPNGAVSNFGRSHDFLLVRGNRKLTVTLTGCRMRNYSAEHPFTIENPNAIVRAVACIDKHEQLFEFRHPPDTGVEE